MYADKRCKLICDNQTRWGSTFIMLASFINARNRGIIFDDSIDFSVIEIYTQILLPIFRINLIFQCNESAIGIVVPILLNTIQDKLETLKINQGSDYDFFRKRLIENIKSKFSFEFDSTMLQLYCTPEL